MFTPIELDKTRNFRYGMKAISLIEKKLDTKIAKINMEDLSMEETATFIWAGLVHEDKKLTVNSVMELVDEHSNITDVLEKMGDAMADTFGADEQRKNLEKVTKAKTK